MAKAKKVLDTRKTYILLRGRHHRREGDGKMTRYCPGDKILLNEIEFKKLGGLKGQRLGLPDEGKPEPAKSKGTSAHKIVKVDGGFNVVNLDTDKALNDEPLTMKEAEALVGG